MCQQLLTVNLDEKLNSSKCNKMMTTLKHSRITALYYKVGYKGSFGVSQVYILWKRLDIKLDKHV